MNAAESLQFAILSREEAVPDGFHDAHWWSEKWSRSLSRTRAKLMAAVRDGTMERAVFTIHNGVRLYPRPHYRARA